MVRVLLETMPNPFGLRISQVSVVSAYRARKNRLANFNDPEEHSSWHRRGGNG
jgi:hypothetical protein